MLTMVVQMNIYKRTGRGTERNLPDFFPLRPTCQKMSVQPFQNCCRRGGGRCRGVNQLICQGYRTSCNVVDCETPPAGDILSVCFLSRFRLKSLTMQTLFINRNRGLVSQETGINAGKLTKSFFYCSFFSKIFRLFSKILSIKLSMKVEIILL